MPSTYSTNLRLELIASGEQANTWGNTTNTNLGTLIESAISGYISLSTMADADYTLMALNGANDQARQMYINVPSGVSLSATRAIIAPSVSKVYVISNNSSGGQAVRIRTSGSTTTCLIPNGQTKTVVCDGTNFSEAVTAIATLTLGGDPTLALQAATKQYVDTADALKLNLTGGTLTGALNLITTTPTGNNATSFNYVNTNYIQKTGSGTQTVDQFLALNYTPSSTSHAVNVSYVSTQLANYVPTSGATMTGALTLLSADPSGAWQATPKSWVETQISNALIDAEDYAIANFVPKTRTISAGTTNVSINGVAGGSADLSANVIISVAASATGVTSIAGTTPILVNGASGVPASGNVTVSIPAADGSTNGYLSSGYWTIFNSKCEANGSNATAGSNWNINILGNATTASSATYATSAGSATTATDATNATYATYLGGVYTASDFVQTSGANGISNSGADVYLNVSSTSNTAPGGAQTLRIGSHYNSTLGYNIAYIGAYSPSAANPVIGFYQIQGSTYTPVAVFGSGGNLNLYSLVAGGSVSADAVTGRLVVSSDQNLKIADGEIENALDKIEALKPRYFYWKNEEGAVDEERGRQLGFYAQEVQAVSEEASPTGLGIYDRALVAMLVKAVQELKAEVNALKGA